MWGAFGVFLEGLARAESGAPGGGLADLRRGVQLLRDQNALFFDGLIKIALAEGEARTGDVDRALAILDEALATSDRIGHRAFDAELHRRRGEMLLKRDPTNPVPAKWIMQELGLIESGTAREPLVPLSDIGRERVRALLSVSPHVELPAGISL